ncbi:hypothetical protein GVO57_10435 [Sphingomonas changnyeongensis]|uniref:Uncharacterized protein n=1 Tax=Sphingomonas changnyeongensis TaxID=2698679 RepID=A0A7Z2S888_9SPHN|nr:hypothetical protein [Sphingomonas changnyeongensis]QHL91156.1 hypothetical protein GVO57_10435 [Sphingomonas changnyeongensis]
MGSIEKGWARLTKSSAIVITWLGLGVTSLLTTLSLIGAPSDVKAAPGQLADIVSWLARTPWWVPALAYAVFAVALLVLVFSSYLKAEARHREAMQALKEARTFFAENTASFTVTATMARLAEIQQRQHKVAGLLGNVGTLEYQAYEVLVYRRNAKTLGGVSRDTVAQYAASFPEMTARTLEELAPGSDAPRVALMDGVDVTAPVAREDEVPEEDRALFRRVVHTAEAARAAYSVASEALRQAAVEVSRQLHEAEGRLPLPPQ